MTAPIHSQNKQIPKPGEARSLEIMLGIAVRREVQNHPWAEDLWRPVSVFLLSGAREPGEMLAQGEGWSEYFAGALPLILHRRETEAYQANLQSEVPAVYVVLRENEEADPDAHGGALPVIAHLITASPFEAQNYLDTGEDIVEPVAMPAPVLAAINDFLAHHHVDEPFRKRQRDRSDPEEHKFGQQPIFLDHQGKLRSRDDG